jgi:hypothetical protein
MRRTAVGILALTLLAISAVGFYHHGFASSDISFFWNSCWRIGLVLGAVWLALPGLLQRRSTASPLMLTLLGLLGLVILARPRSIVVLWPILIILGVIQFFSWLVRPPAR